jgi:sulfite exporter TauE/SafE
MNRMVLTEGFLLGLASGGVCLAYCAPVLVPYLLGEGKPVRSSAVAVGGFLSGRLAGYLAFAVLAWLTHFALVDNLPHQKIVTGAATIVLALLLIAYGCAGPSPRCRAATTARLGRLPLRSPFLVPAFLGVITGVSVCPPFLMAFENAAQFSTLRQSLLFFGAFFIGTSVYLAPLPLVGLAGRHEVIRIVGRLASGVVGLFYLYSGFVNLIAGLR